MGLAGYLDSTPLVLSNDANSFGINRKNYRENSDRFFSTETTIERLHKFAYTCMSHDCVPPPLPITQVYKVQ